MRLDKKAPAYAGLLIMLVVLMGLSGCGATVTDALSPAQLRVSIDIKDYHQGTTQVAIHFADHALNTVEFVHGETVTCNGVFLKYDSGFYAQMIGYGAYTGEVPLQPAGGSYTFVYTPAASAGGSAITISVAVVNAPLTLTYPTSDATVPIPRTGSFIARYTPSGLANSVVVGSASDSRAHLTVTLALADSGSVTFNSSGFKDFEPGAGLLSLSRITSSKPGGLPFAAVNVSYENITTIPVIWQ